MTRHPRCRTCRLPGATTERVLLHGIPRHGRSGPANGDREPSFAGKPPAPWLKGCIHRALHRKQLTRYFPSTRLLAHLRTSQPFSQRRMKTAREQQTGKALSFPRWAHDATTQVIAEVRRGSIQCPGDTMFVELPSRAKQRPSKPTAHRLTEAA